MSSFIVQNRIYIINGAGKMMMEIYQIAVATNTASSSHANNSGHTVDPVININANEESD